MPQRHQALWYIKPLEESDDVETWVDRAHADTFILSLPKTWDTIIRVDRSQNYNFMDSMKPDHSIQENKAIPVFFVRKGSLRGRIVSTPF